MPIHLLYFLSTILAAGASASPSATFSVSVDISEVDQYTYDTYAFADFYKSLFVRVVRENFSLVDAGGPAQIKLSIRREKDLLLVEAEAGAVRQIEKISLRHDNLVDLHLNLLHQSMALIRKTADHLQQPLQEPDQSEKPTGPPPLEPAGEPSRQWRFDAMLGAAGLFSTERIDPLLSLSGHLHRGEGWGFGVTASILLPNPDDASLHVMEWGTSGCVNFRLTLLENRLDWVSELAAGIWQSRYTYEGAGKARSTGNIEDILITGQTALALRIISHLDLLFFLGIQSTSKSYVHVYGADELWNSPAIRGLVGLSIAYVSDE
jgi:hypothetical protein